MANNKPYIGYFPKKPDSTTEKLYATSVWECVKPLCTCWMREEYTFKSAPLCTFCGTSMVLGTRMLSK